MNKINIIDVGSAGNIFEPWFSNSENYDYLLKFEPRDNKEDDEKVLNCDKALWKEECVHPFYIYKGFDGTGSSLFMQNYDYVGKNYSWLSKLGNPKFAETWFERSSLVETLQIQCSTLDKILDELSNRPKFHLLKIDAQGAEFEILNGSLNYLKNECIALHLELFNLPMYKGIKLYAEVKLFLKTIGFKEVKAYESHGTFECAQDRIFLKENIAIEDQPFLNTILKAYEI